MSKKYEFTDETIKVDGHTLHRIRAVRCFSDIEAGDLGGWIEKEENLSQIGDAWIGGNAKVYGMAKVYGHAMVFGKAEICGNAFVRSYAEICGDAVVKNNEDYIVFKNFWSSGRHFTWTKSNNMWKVGCFYGTCEELIKKAYKDSERSGREYERVVRYVESILADEKNEKE